jgi:hypothetical protein
LGVGRLALFGLREQKRASLLRRLGAARQAHSLFRRSAFATDDRAANGLSLDHPLAVMTTVVVMMTVVAVMPVVAALPEGGAAAGHEDGESEKGADLLHP